jgi:oligosaccharide repeat unit polymerase
MPMAYLSISFFIVFRGFFAYKDNKFNSIKIENIQIYSIIEKTLIAGGLGAIIFFLPFAIKALSGDINMNRLAVGEFQQTVLASYGLLNSFLSLFANCFILSIIFAFINIARGERYYRKAYLHLISSFSYVIYVLAYVGRDGVIFWAMSYIFCFLIFKQFISSAIQKKIKQYAIISLSILIIPFMAITIARFAKSTGGISWQLISYAGQQIQNFNDAFNINAPLTYGRGAFKEFIAFFDFIGLDITKGPSKDVRWSYYLEKGVQPWVFRTFIGSLMSDFGKFGTIVFLMLFYSITLRSLKRLSKTGIFNLSNLVLFMFLYQVVLFGIFYFRLADSNFYIITIFLLYILLKLSNCKEKSILINKIED